MHLIFLQLILMTPKSLLRLPEARSSFDEISGDTRFRRMIPEEGEAANVNAAGVTKLLLCSGRVFYDLRKERNRRGLEDQIAIARVEQVRSGFQIVCC